MNEIFKSPIDFALKKTMSEFEKSNEDNDKLIYETLRRSKAMWDKIRINGLEICGMTYDEFCKQLEKKNNVVFLSDDEVEDFNKAIKIMNIL